MDDRTPGRRAAFGLCCAIVLLLVVLPLALAGIAVWLLLRNRDRIVGRYRDRIAGRLPEGCAGALPAAAVRAYQEFLAELESPPDGDQGTR